MWKSIRDLFATWEQAPQEPLPVAVAGLALLIEIARADDSSQAAERAEIVAAAERVFRLDADTVAPLLAQAEDAVEHAVSLTEFTQVVNARLDRADKLALLEDLWRVAYADGRLDRYEEYYLRKIADLLHLGHSDLIRAKLRVAPV
jgi:uncharacterized tellurite resistance protein B-like protein